MQETIRYLLTIVNLYQSSKATIVSRYLLVSCMLKKWLRLCSQHPSSKFVKQIYLFVGELESIARHPLLLTAELLLALIFDNNYEDITNEREI